MKDAGYYREYRRKRRYAGYPVPRGSDELTKWRHAHFIAWDGEGVNTEDGHELRLFANSEGSFLRSDVRLRTEALFDLLLTESSKHSHAIHVIYNGSYDVIHILYDLSLAKLTELQKQKRVIWNSYRIRYVPRKYLSIFHIPTKRSIMLWDVIGFFQSTFVKALETWLGKGHPDLAIIIAGKGLRSKFSETDTDYIQAYNDAELRCLVQMMQKLHQSLVGLAIPLNRWDGSGAIASSLMRMHTVKSHVIPPPPAAELAARHAYFGGRIECMQFGVSTAPVYGYDINSAYPYAAIDLPSLIGEWHHQSDDSITDNPISVYHVRWDVGNQRLCPFPYRYSWHAICFPSIGEGWYWHPEVRAAVDCGMQATVLESYQFHPTDDHQPFAWIADIYEERRRLIKSGDTTGMEKVIKLGINSVYGKLAQNVGYEPERGLIPPYHSLVYAGLITSRTRATLYRVAMQRPDDVVMLMTDGIITTSPLDLPISTDKTLGAWEATIHHGFVAIQSGVYALGIDETADLHTRGVERILAKESKVLERVFNEWKAHPREPRPITLSIERMVTLGMAVESLALFPYRGCWIVTERQVTTEPLAHTKRIRDPNSSNHRPSEGLVTTLPTENWTEHRLSHPYERPWDRLDWVELVRDDG